MRILQLRWTNEPGLPVVILRGDVDASAALELRAVGIVADDVPAIVVDLSEVVFVDIAGLDLLEELACRANVEIRHPTPPVSRLLQRTEHVIDDWKALRDALD